MPKTMLIDAYHREETRVAVLQGGKVEDFDFEYASRKPLRGNIYLARVTRVEPSLQAAFVEYGGNRHGFLAFGEIHPDYYQIPVADREVLRKAEALEVELAQKLADLSNDDDQDDIDPDEDEIRASADVSDEAAEAAAADTSSGDEPEDDDGSESPEATAPDYAPMTEEQDVGGWHGADADLVSTVSETVEENKREEEEEEEERLPDTGDVDGESGGDADENGDGETSEPKLIKMFYPAVDKQAAEEAAAKEAQAEINRLRARYEEAKRDRNRLLRAYKIQEVIKRRQIMLVQVVKEERGNKGAALTTYLSLAGRYGVLMPNTARGGGISRKITSQGDRKRLKKAMKDFDIPSNMGLIIRTAGSKRTKTEIRRDYDYLMRLWETIRDKTLESVAPALIYEEASLMKRAIRDLYDKDTDTIVVHGEEGYREAKAFMKMLMPSHAKHVQQHNSDTPLFMKYRVEDQLDQMFQPVVQLKSGGYLVIQQTEALVSIDVNSGKSTKERNVEQTALKTNTEAAAEVARQCRLRDLAGLIVIDFIDMEENRNNRAVEKKLKEAMKNDRARTQIGSISTFGLLEMSRQRRRSGIVDGTTQACPVCQGAGAVRSHEMAALRILRAAESEATRRKHGLITVKTSTEVALYILNTKRDWLLRVEGLYGVKTNVLADTGKFGDQYEVQGSGTPTEGVSLKDTVGDDGPLTDLEAPELPSGDGEAQKADDNSGDGDDKPKRRRRRRRRRRDDDGAENTDENSAKDNSEARETASDDADGDDDKGDDKSRETASSDDADGDSEGKRKRRRGRRGGRRNRRKAGEGEAAGNADETTDNDAGSDGQKPADKTPEPVAAEASQPEAETAGKPSGDVVNLDDKRDQQQAKPEASAEDDAPDSDQADSSGETNSEAKAETPENNTAPEPQKPRRGGWWQRALKKS